MTLQEIKAAVESGQRVCWASEAYEVRRVGNPGDYDWLIVCTLNQNTIGLTWRDEVTMNGRPEQFFISPQPGDCL